MGGHVVAARCRRVMGLALGTSAVALGLAAAPALATNPACPTADSSTATSCTWTTPGTPTFTVPANVTALDVVAAGASGGPGEGGTPGNVTTPGGAGTSLDDTSVPVTPAQTLNVVVGGAGTGPTINFCTPCNSSAGKGGTPGGGGDPGSIYGGAEVEAGGGGGGGYSGILETDGTQLVIAAGGGGGGAPNTCAPSGGAAGGAGDLNGRGGSNGGTYTLGGSWMPGAGGHGGTPTTGGLGGAGSDYNCGNDLPNSSGHAGSHLQGGSTPSTSDGGGGGGGYFGGGAGGQGDWGGGGGGGSSMAVHGWTKAGTAHNGSGTVTISWSRPLTYVSSLGSSGSGDGQFGSPKGIVVDPANGVVFVADYPNSRIEVFGPDGTFLNSIPTTGNPYAIAGDFTSSPGTLYVVEPFNSGPEEVEMIGADGTPEGFVSEMPGGSTSLPLGIAVDTTRHEVYVTDSGTNQIDKFDESGNYQGSFDGTSTGSGGLSGPTGIGVDLSTGNFYVADSGDRIVKFDSTDAFVTDFSDGGSGPGELTNPDGVAVQAGTGYVFVADTNDNRMERFASDGTYNGVWGSTGKGYGQFRSPADVGLATDGSFYVTDSDNARVEKFGSPGALAKFVIGTPSSFTAGTAHTVTVTPEDYAGNVIGDYAGSPSWSDSSGQLSGSPATFSSGESVNRVTLTPTHADQITVTDGSVTSTSKVFNVPGSLAKFVVSGPGSGSVGSASTVTIKAQDSAGNVLANYAGSPTWSDASGQVGGHPGPFSHGESTNSETFANAVRDDQITVSDGSVSGHSAPFSRVGPLAQFTLSTPSSMTTGTAVTLTLTARDSAGNRLMSYAGTPTWSDQSNQITGSPTSFSAGVSQTSVTFAQPVHGDAITVVGGAVSSKTKTFSVLGPFAKFAIHVPASATHGTPFPVTLDAEDGAGNLVKTYAGTPTWSDTSNQLTGSPAAFSGGVSTNSVTLANPVKSDRIEVTAGGITSQSGKFPVG
jgi:DNA-binding beta-propeller fold protein YncE